MLRSLSILLLPSALCFFSNFRFRNPQSRLHSSESLFNPADDELYTILLDQISDMSNKPDGYIPKHDYSLVQRKINLSSRKFIENHVALEPGIPIEIIYKRKLMFGNFQRVNANPASIKVSFASGAVVDVDASQVISSWDVLADEVSPATPEAWAAVAMEALDILRDMSPRKSDLEEFHRLVSTQRSASLPVDSLDLGVYIFQERRVKDWLNPYTNAEDTGVFALSAAQRYAAALLIFHDDFHFKRRPSTAIDKNASSQQSEASDDDDLDQFMKVPSSADESEGVLIVEGGYKPLDEGVVLFKEGDVFVAYYEDRRAPGSAAAEPASKQSPFRAGHISKQLRAMEMYSMSPPNMPPPPAVKHILKRLGLPIGPPGARQLLTDINHQTSTPASRKDVSPASVTPWSEECLTAAQALCDEVQSRRKELSQSLPGRSGKRGASGRMDFRGANLLSPAICIDNPRASFYDDAFSLSPETGEVLVHIVDVNEYLRRYPVLQQIAQERLVSTFLPSGPLHMIPPIALDGLKLSTQYPNEVVTVGLSVDDVSGELIGFRVFPSIIGPVFPIDIETADDILQQLKASEEEGRNVVKRAGFSDIVLSNLRRANKIVDKMIARQPWVDEQFAQSSAVDYNLDKKTGVYQQVSVKKNAANRMINALLTAYSNASCEFCLARDVSIPIVFENRDKQDSARVSRFGTRPLRSWIAQLQQKQLRAAMKVELPLSRKECALAVAHYNANKKQLSSLERAGRTTMSFESLESYCKSMAQSGQQAIVTAEGVGRGGEVRIKDYQVQGVVSRTLERGELLRVVVKRVVPETKSVVLEIA